MQDNKTNKKILSATGGGGGGGGLTGVPVCNMASKLMKHNYIAQMSLKLESTFREFNVGLCLEKLQTPDTLCIRMGDESHKNKESILLQNTAVAPDQAHSQFSLFTD